MALTKSLSKACKWGSSNTPSLSAPLRPRSGSSSVPRAVPAGSSSATSSDTTSARSPSRAADVVHPHRPATPLDVRAMSLLLLVHESIRRATGTPLVDVSDTVKVAQALWDMPCCLVLMLRPQTLSTSSSDSSSSSSSSSGSHEAIRHIGGLELRCANAAALAVLSGGRASASIRDAAILPHGQGDEFYQVTGELDGRTPRVEVVHGLQWRDPAPASDDDAASRFVADTVVCDIASPSGATIGRALLFDRWLYPDGRLGRPGCAPLAPEEVPGPAELQAAEEAVRQQADRVRSSKAVAAKGDGSTTELAASVTTAVSQLQDAKDRLTALQRAARAFQARGGVLDKLIKDRSRAML